MLHAIPNTLAFTPIIHRAPPEITNLQTIINQVQEFYGKGWDTILWEVGLIVVLITGVLGVLAPLIINSQMEKRLERKISRAQRRANWTVLTQDYSYQTTNPESHNVAKM
ncbi:MAG: hypothetical protein ACP5I8_13335 [Phycisphaerae bacterium]